MKPIATDTYNFERLMTDGYTYVDKTEVLYPLINKSIGSQFFLSRPRRFGKSLLVSTFKSLFQGRRDLFKGLAIDSLEYDWRSYPVLHLDMGSMQAPIVVAWSRPLKDGRYRCEVVASYKPEDARDIRGMEQKCICDLERIIRRHPSAWVLYYNFFRNISDEKAKAALNKSDMYSVKLY